MADCHAQAAHGQMSLMRGLCCSRFSCHEMLSILKDGEEVRVVACGAQMLSQDSRNNSFSVAKNSLRQADSLLRLAVAVAPESKTTV